MRVKWCCLLLGLLLAPLQAKTLLIGGLLEPPLKYLDQAGNPTGLDVDIISRIFGTLSQPFRIELIDSGARLNRSAREGRYDMLLSYSYRPEREAYLIYPAESHIIHSWYFFVRKEERGRIQFGRLEDLKPWRLGLTRDFAYTPEINAIEGDSSWQVQVVSMNMLQLRKLAQGRIDVVPMQLASAFAQIHAEGLEGKLDYLPRPIRSSTYFNVWCKARADAGTPALMRAYDAELRRMKEDGRLRGIYAKYGVPYSEP